jgi:hypothetical protein
MICSAYGFANSLMLDTRYWILDKEKIRAGVRSPSAQAARISLDFEKPTT